MLLCFCRLTGLVGRFPKKAKRHKQKLQERVATLIIAESGRPVSVFAQRVAHSAGADCALEGIDELGRQRPVIRNFQFVTSA